MSNVKGYKIISSYWNGATFQYEVGKTYELKNHSFECCENGFDFCTKLNDCFYSYFFNLNDKVIEIEALGNVFKDENSMDTTMFTDKIKVIRELSWQEVLDIVNIGRNNSGYENVGNCNTGCENYGSKNNGSYNFGNFNKGSYNNGFDNNGKGNKGARNNGNFNFGNHNNGSYNKCDFSFGLFCTKTPKIFIFGKLSDWTYEDWINSKAYDILSIISPYPTEWVCEYNMTNEEKLEHKEYDLLGGYLKTKTEEEIKEEWNDNWNELSDKDREIIMNIPNFDADIFKEITGIDVRKDND